MALTDKLTAIADAIRSKSGKTAKIPLADMPAEIINLQSLNFEVISYKSVSELPETAKQNTIAVFTDNMTGYTFNPEEPANPKEGLVWFKTGNSSSVAFDVVGDDPIRICPVGAYQYSNGAFKSIEAKTYLNGWIDWKFDLYLIQNGVYNEEVFGKATTLWAQINSNGITMGRDHYVEVSNFVDFSKYHSAEIDVTTYNYCDVKLQFMNNAGGSAGEVTFGVTGTGKATASLASINGSYRVKIYGVTSNDSNHIVFDNMRFIS